MKASEGHIGRVFMIRLEEGDIVPQCIEQFAAQKNIAAGLVTLIGGIGSGEVVVGPRNSTANPPDPMLVPLDGAHETLGIGIIAPDIEEKPVLHIHAALGRAGKTTTGCLRAGVETWLVGEVIIYEILDTDAKRILDKESGFTLLKV